MCNSTPNTGFKMALFINDSQNKFSQFTSEKLRGFMSASSANSPWAVKVKFVLFPSHTSSSPSSSVIKIMRAKLCLSYTYENSSVFHGVTQMFHGIVPVAAEPCHKASTTQGPAHRMSSSPLSSAPQHGGQCLHVTDPTLQCYLLVTSAATPGEPCRDLWMDLGTMQAALLIQSGRSA